MEPRLDIRKVAAAGYQAMAALESYGRNTSLEATLLELAPHKKAQGRS